ncbi:aldose epimerase family protein [uncultured Lutibacter sp.]|uniref:aldose epimerase family protein n=1 Tax=uncultured Lutibacter sp. TaxID=437739 RepID=UPI00262E0649|nr:aldose epimerase family protein [uncultured Lutibacter sp.]
MNEQQLRVIKLTNSNGLELEISNFGATIIGLKILDKNQNLINVVASLEAAEDYTKQFYTDKGLYLGATVGRYAGRISKGSFKINEEVYPIANKNGVHLHGGEIGFDKKYWKVESFNEGLNSQVTLSYISNHLEEGYPGNLKTYVTYNLSEQNEVKIIYKAKTDKETFVNLTNHSYFNLNGKDTVLDHKLMIHSLSYLDVNEQLIPSGKLIDSLNTRFDRNELSLLGRKDFTGFDDTFVLGEENLKAILVSPKTGIQMEVYTNQPASVVYTPVQLPTLAYKNGVNFSNFSAICFETQNFPDAPNNNNFPSSILKPGDEYLNETIFKFSVI